VGRAVGSTDRANRALQECKECLHSVAQWEAGELKLTGQQAHILVRGGQQRHASGRKCFGLGLRARAAVAYDNPVVEPAGKGREQLAVIDRGRGEIKGAEAPCVITLHVQLQALPPAHAVLGFARPGPKGAVLNRPRDVTNRQGGRILQDNGIRPLGLAITLEPQR